MEMPEVVKRWFYQQNLRADTSAYVSESIPETLHDTIEYNQRFEDSRKATRTKPAQATNSATSTHNDGRGQFSRNKSHGSGFNPIRLGQQAWPQRPLLLASPRSYPRAINAVYCAKSHQIVQLDALVHLKKTR